MTQKRDAMQICEANTAEARAKEVAARAKLREDFPDATELAKRMAAELAAERSWPGHPLFKPRVVRMTQGDKSWSR